MFGSAASVVSSSLPVPAVTVEQAGKAAAGFSEAEALKHVKALAEFASHPASASGHDLDSALQYVFKQGQTIKETSPEDVDVEVVPFPPESGDSDLKHVVIKVLPKNVSEANENSILVSAHIDTVFSAEGAGDDTSNVAVMLELARGISQTAHGFKNSVIFLFNTGEEEGLDGSHSFITQHPWSSTIRLAIDLEGQGMAGRSSTFQAVSHQASGFKNPALFLFDQGKEEDGSHSSKTQNPPKKLVLDLEALGSTGGKSSKYDFQDLFSSGVIKSATDFQIYKEIGGLSGLDFAYTDKGAVYHTKNDKLELLKSGSLQHLGENMLPFLLQVASSPILS